MTRFKKRQAQRPPKPAVPAAPPVVYPPLDPRVLQGLGFFNHHQFFQSHEILEEVWKETAGRDKDFYKGLIQAAVAFYHWSRGNRPGALTLARSAAKYLKKYDPHYLGIDVGEFLKKFTELFQWLRRHRLRYDAHLVPKIRGRFELAPHPESSEFPQESI